MTLPIIITDPKSGATAKVTKGNALAVGPSSPSVAFNASFTVDDTPVEVVKGRGGEIFCITSIILTGDKSIQTGVDATVTLFEATADDLTASLSDLLVIPVARSSQAIITGILIEVAAGRFIMGKTDDNNVLCTIFGFYV